MDPIIGGALISGGASVLGSALGFGTQAKNFKNQKKLMRIQQEYARENATTQYNRQRDLTHDSWALNVAGQRDAGINPSFVDGSVSGNTPSVGAADAPPIPSADMDAVGVGNMFTNVGNNAAHILTAISDSKLKEQQAQTQRIDNITRLSENLARLAKMKGEAKTAEARGDIDEQLKEQTKLFESMSMRDKLAMLQNDRSVSDIYANLYGDMAQNKLALLRNQVREAYYSGEIKKKDFEAYDKRLQNELLQGSARAALDYANAAVAPTQAALNRSATALNKANAQGVQLDNRLKTLTFDDKLIESFESAEQSKLRTVGMKLQNLPHSVSEHFTRSALFALERIQKGHGSPADFALVASQTAREYTMYSNDQAKDWAKILLGVIPGSSSGSSSSSPSSGYVVNSPNVPQYK